MSFISSIDGLERFLRLDYVLACELGGIEVFLIVMDFCACLLDRQRGKRSQVLIYSNYVNAFG